MEKKSVFVWRTLRILFYIFVLSWIFIALSIIIRLNILFNYSFIFMSLISFSVFILSIIHLVKYSRKALAITALVLSMVSILFLTMMFTLAFLVRPVY